MKISPTTSLPCVIVFLMVAILFASPCAAQEKVRFPIGESSKTLSYGPLWVAGKMGFFEREGLEVPIVTMRGSPLTIQALTADSIYVANATVDTLISAYEKGADITMIGGLINGLGLSMIGGKAYKSYADLRGTTIGTQTLTSGTGFALRLVLKAHGLEYPRDYALLNIGSAPDRYRALTSGQISSAPVGVPLDLVAKQQGFNIIGYFADDQPNFQFNVYIVKRSWAEKNRPLVVRFMKAMASTMRWMLDNREAACAYLTKEMAISLEHCRYASEFNWNKRIWDRNADLNVEGVRTLIKITAEQGILKEPLPEPAKYMDPSYLKQALAEIGKK
ncbi:MAG: ABC transporter substrate-binding protein [Deltaproteobacteria bacterium]|nr:ABC transporter substrate-binding protein [Deltaproteobacteria bacterium]